MPRLEQLLEFPSHLPHANSVLIALKYHLGEIIAKYLRFQFIKKKKKHKSKKENTHIYTLPVISQNFGRWGYPEKHS